MHADLMLAPRLRLPARSPAVLGSAALTPGPESAVKKSKPLPHRNRGKTNRMRAGKKAKLRRTRLRSSRGERRTYR